MAPNPYLTSRIRDALARSNGSASRAGRLVLQWAGRDDRLLRMLVAPYIRGIVAETVGRHAAHLGTPGGAIQDADGQSAKISLDAVVDRMGERFGGVIEPPRGMTALLHGAGAKTRDAGKRHADSLRTLAVAFARKRFDP